MLSATNIDWYTDILFVTGQEVGVIDTRDVW